MRRYRDRYFTIEAENEEEYIKEFEKIKKSKLSTLNFEDKKEENIQENGEEKSFPKNKNTFNFNDEFDDEEYCGLGGLQGIDEEEDNLGVDLDEDDIIKESEDSFHKKENNEEKGLDILCYYLKNSITEKSKDKISNETIFYNNKNSIRALSGNAIYDLNIRDLIDNILADNDNEYTKSNEGSNNCLRDYIFQNIESDSNLKIMIMSNNKSTKNSFIDKFFGEKNKREKNKDEILEEPFEIRKKQIKLFNKNITLQIFDTSDEFHNNPISDVYYKAVSAFFIFIESSNHNVKKYLDFIYEKINKYISNKTCVLFGINMLFKEDCTIEGENLRDIASEKNMMFIPIKIKDFDMKNNLIVNLFNLILIKGIDNKNNEKSLRKGSKEKKLGGFRNNLTSRINKDSTNNNYKYDITKMNIPSSLGYKKKYRINHINIFDIDDYNKEKTKRKLSCDI